MSPLLTLPAVPSPAHPCPSGLRGTGPQVGGSLGCQRNGSHVWAWGQQWGRPDLDLSRDLATLSHPLLWTRLLVMPGMQMKYRRPVKFKFQINNG